MDGFEKRFLKIAGICAIPFVISVIFLLVFGQFKNGFLNAIIFVPTLGILPIVIGVAFSLILAHQLKMWYKQKSKLERLAEFLEFWASLHLFALILGVVGILVLSVAGVVGIALNIINPILPKSLFYAEISIGMVLSILVVIGIFKKYTWGYYVLMIDTIWGALITPILNFNYQAGLGWIVATIIYVALAYYFYYSKPYFTGAK